MLLRADMKQPSARGMKIEPIPFELDCCPDTAGELIAAAAKKCAEEYNERVRRGGNVTSPLDERTVKDMASLGRIAFGITCSSKEQDIGKAAENALLAFEDGLFRMFVNGTEITSADQKLELRENDTVTFIRLTMLTGRMW